jgi:hydrogenase expression/formation protein HypD
MKYVDEFRDADLARRLVREIRWIGTRRWVLMEVCGGQTHSLLRHGIEAELADSVELIHAPGCPVCVTPIEAIDFARELSLRPGMIVTSFGDMLRVPGSGGSLLDARSHGAMIRTVYSPLDAVELARKNPREQVVFFAVGFETTTPATALAAMQAASLGLENFSLLVAHVRVQPAMEALLEAPDNRIQAFLAAGHVCAVMGFDSYGDLVSRYRVPVVVTGFEPVDLLQGILECVGQLEQGRAEVANCYGRSVHCGGNRAAQQLVARVYEVADRPWRGLGIIPAGGLALRAEFARFDAAQRFGKALMLPVVDDNRCRSGDVLSGRIRPTECSSFGTLCRPESPLGAPMVSSEGACAAYYQYRRERMAASVVACELTRSHP